MIYRAAALYAVKIENFRKPASITELVAFPDRSCKPLRMHRQPNSAHTRKHNYFAKILEIYNSLPNFIKNNSNMKAKIRLINQFVRPGLERDWLKLSAIS